MCFFLLYRKRNPPYMYIHALPFEFSSHWTHLSALGSLCYGVSSHWLSVLYIVSVVSDEFINLGCIRAERPWHSIHSSIINSRCSESFRRGGWSVPGEAGTLAEPWVWVLLRFPLSLSSIWMDCLNCPSRQMCSARTCHRQWKLCCFSLS